MRVGDRETTSRLTHPRPSAAARRPRPTAPGGSACACVRDSAGPARRCACPAPQTRSPDAAAASGWPGRAARRHSAPPALRADGRDPAARQELGRTRTSRHRGTRWRERMPELNTDTATTSTSCSRQAGRSCSAAGCSSSVYRPETITVSTWRVRTARARTSVSFEPTRRGRRVLIAHRGERRERLREGLLHRSLLRIMEVQDVDALGAEALEGLLMAATDA